MDKDLGRGENRQNPEEKQGDKIRQQPVLGKQDQDQEAQDGHCVIQECIRTLFSNRKIACEAAGDHVAAVVQPDTAFGAIGIKNAAGGQADDYEVQQCQPK